MSPALVQRVRHPAPWTIDLAIALLLAGPVLGTAIGRASGGPPQVLDGLLGLGAIATIFARRAQPILALAVAIGIGIVLPDVGTGVVPGLVILYTLATRQPWPAPALPAIAVVLATAVAKLVSTHPERVVSSIGIAVECSAAVALGLYTGARRTTLDALRDRADRADRERELLADRAVAQERLRIAQDLHDVVAHNVSLMVVGAQALGVTVDDERVRTATDAIADLGRQAMTEMHRTLRLLRDHDLEAADRAPQPSLANLDKLIEQSRASGMEVDLTIEGEPRPLAQTVELSAFRIVQEALTNVIKHAGRAHTSVTVAYRNDGLELRITDSGHGRLPGPLLESDDDHAPVDGHGVIGMRERAALFGGTLTAQPRLDHGFEVTAILPYTDPGS
ncbi:MAG TPA: histidine kinase [Solirubrobacteraceae bacterium]|jgi:signal transduction histidine kinase|nr:histidine kinase [Solirubrobacteraceae bacterium]